MTDRLPDFTQVGVEVDTIPVHINHDIIRLFSEGLYRSPYKAIEELATNAYDAGAKHVHILLPTESDDGSIDSPLWVIDDGHGMDRQGFHDLWHIAKSRKTSLSTNLAGRLPIGQFGIGKLAAYVLAWKLTHMSLSHDQILLTTLDFRQVTGTQTQPTRVHVSLREINEQEARDHLDSIRRVDPEAWNRIFGDQRSCGWTVARLTDFKDLYGKLQPGRLRWVLRTVLPLESQFKIYLNANQVVSSKYTYPEITTKSITVDIPEVGKIRGRARIFEKPLDTGKASDIGRSHGFFIRVRGRVINLDDPLFGIDQPNFSAWSRFSMEVEANGLHGHLLSSREGVRDSRSVQQLRQELLNTFKECRQAYDEWKRKHDPDIDVESILADTPSMLVTDPLLRSVRNTIEAGQDSFYINTVQNLGLLKPDDWLQEYRATISQKPIKDVIFGKSGLNAPAIAYHPASQELIVNLEHPFVQKTVSGGGSKKLPAKLFASSELLLEGQLQDHGLTSSSIAAFLRDRDSVLRLLAGQESLTAAQVLRQLVVANNDRDLLEIATGSVFHVLGFEYEKRGGHKHGADGILCARLGKHIGPQDYKLVYDAKQTKGSAVPVEKIRFESLEMMRREEKADYGFFVAVKYMGEDKEDSQINKLVRRESNKKITLLKISDLNTLVTLHYQYGLTLTEVCDLFKQARSPRDVAQWLEDTKARLETSDAVPVDIILKELDKQKDDLGGTPNIAVARQNNPRLKKFVEERLVIRLQAVETIVGRRWIEVEKSGQVRMHQTADNILEKLDRSIIDLDLGTFGSVGEKNQE